MVHWNKLKIYFVLLTCFGKINSINALFTSNNDSQKGPKMVLEFAINKSILQDRDRTLQTTNTWDARDMANDSLRTYVKGILHVCCGQSHFSEINVKLAEKNKNATHSVQRSLEMCKNK